MSREGEARIIEALAQELATIDRDPNFPILFYAEAGPAWAGGSIFAVRGDRVEFVDRTETDMLVTVMDLWNLALPGKKWRGITMVIEGDRFRTEFDYGEGWSEDDDEGDRREPIVRAHFGDKPIHYPPLEGAEPWPGK